MAKHDLNDPKRRVATTEAVYQIEQLLTVVLDAAKSEDRHEGLQFLIKGIVPRLLQLNEMIMHAVSAEDLSTESVFKSMEF